MTNKLGYCFGSAQCPLWNGFASEVKGCNSNKINFKNSKGVDGASKTFQVLWQVLNKFLSLARRQNLSGVKRLIELDARRMQKRTNLSFVKEVLFLSMFPMSAIARGFLKSSLCPNVVPFWHLEGKYKEWVEE